MPLPVVRKRQLQQPKCRTVDRPEVARKRALEEPVGRNGESLAADIGVNCSRGREAHAHGYRLGRDGEIVRVRVGAQREAQTLSIPLEPGLRHLLLTFEWGDDLRYPQSRRVG